MEYNHNRPLEDFLNEINIIKENGFNPIAVTQMYFEDVYVFETKEEARAAYEKLELGRFKNDDIIVGFWYDKDAFLKEVEQYEAQIENKVLIHYLHGSN